MRQFIAIVLSLALVTSGLAQGPAGIGGATPRTSAVRNSFQDLTSHLDPGGNLYLYVSTEELLKGLSTQVSQWRTLFENLPDMSPEEKQNIGRIFDVISSLIKNSGVEDVSGFGLSSIAIEKELYRVTSMLHHYKGNDTGYLWSLLGKKSHPLTGLDMMPSNAALAWHSDLDVPLLWTVLNNEIGKSGIPGAREMLQSLPMAFQDMTGADFAQVLASLGGEYGVVVTLDESRMMTLPMPTGSSINIPEVGGMLMIKTRNDAIFNLIDSALGGSPEVVKSDRAGLRMRTMMPPAQSNSSLRPSFAQSGDYLFLASNSALIEEAMAVRAGSRPGLKTTAEFKRFSQGTPDQGNSFSFVSPKVGQILSRIQTQALESATTDPAQRQLLAGFFGAAGMSGSYGVAANSDEGWISVANTTSNPANILMLPLTLVPMIIATVAIPNLLRSRNAANESAAIANLRAINVAEVVYYSTSNKYADIPALVKDGLLDERFLGSVSGYRFDVDTSLRGDYLARAIPLDSNAGRWGYYSTKDGVLRYSLDPALAPPGQGGAPIEGQPGRRGVVRNEPSDTLPSATLRTP